jgi:dTDP-glucose 4,6-dehydratase
MHHILVTGGAGFIGGAFVRGWLARRLGPVVNLDKLTYAGNLASIACALKHPAHVFVEGDVADRDLTNRLLKEYRPQAIVHFAAESHVDRSIQGPDIFVATNVLGTYSLLQAALEYWHGLTPSQAARFRFLHVSTDEVYGTLGPTGAFTESTPYAPRSPYSASKAAADHFVRAYYHTYGLPTLVTNCSNNYGPYQFPEKLIPLVILNALEGRSLPVYGDGKQVRDWLFVEDHCRALRSILRRAAPGETFHVGGETQRTNLQIVEEICDLVDRLRPKLPHVPCRQLIKFVEDRPGHDRRYAMDAAKLKRQVGWRPLHSLESGLRLTVDWYLKHPQWTEQVTSGIYNRERLGLVCRSA